MSNAWALALRFLVASTRDDGRPRNAIRSGGRGRSVRAAAAAKDRARLAGFGAWRRRRDAAQLPRESGCGTGGSRRGHVSLPISLHGATAHGSGPAAGAEGDGEGSRGRRGESDARTAAVCRWQIDGRADDFARRGGWALAGNQGHRVFRVSVASAEAAEHEARRSLNQGGNADAVPAGNAGHAGGADAASSCVREAGSASDVADYRDRGSFVSRAEEFGQERCRSDAGVGANRRSVDGEKDF